MKYTRIAIHDLKPGTIAFTLDRAENELLPLFRTQPGFISYAVYQVSDHQVASVSRWETREAADNATRLAEDWIKDSMPGSVSSSRVVVGELVFESEGPSLTAGEEPAPLH
jgi:hypothetical protein